MEQVVIMVWFWQYSKVCVALSQGTLMPRKQLYTEEDLRSWNILPIDLQLRECTLSSSCISHDLLVVWIGVMIAYSMQSYVYYRLAVTNTWDSTPWAVNIISFKQLYHYGMSSAQNLHALIVSNTGVVRHWAFEAHHPWAACNCCTT